MAHRFLYTQVQASARPASAKLMQGTASSLGHTHCLGRLANSRLESNIGEVCEIASYAPSQIRCLQYDAPVRSEVKRGGQFHRHLDHGVCTPGWCLGLGLGRYIIAHPTRLTPIPPDPVAASPASQNPKPDRLALALNLPP